MNRIFTINNIKAFILSIVIAIVLASFVIYLVQSFDPSPKWEDYCGDVVVPRAVPLDKGPAETNETECIEQGGTWRNGYCDYYYECQQEYDKANERHRQIVFFVTVPAGLIAVAIGIILALPSVSSGLMLGGVILTIYGVGQYWSDLSNWARAIILGIVLVILIWLGYKKLKT